MQSYPYKFRSVLYTFAHFAVDAICFFFLFGTLTFLRTFPSSGVSFVTIFLVYNLVAFGLQWIWGLVLDKKPTLPTGIIGVILVGVSFLPYAFLLTEKYPTWAMFLILIVMATGNAAFHVEGGRDSYIYSNNTETRTGVFASGGAAGVIVGMLLPGLVEVGLLITFILWILALVTVIGLRVSSRKLLAADTVTLVRPILDGNQTYQIARTDCRVQHPETLSGELSRYVVLSASIAAVLLVLQVIALPQFEVTKQILEDGFGVLEPAVIVLMVLLVLSRLVGGFISAKGEKVVAGMFIFAAIASACYFFLGTVLPGLALGLLTGYASWQYFTMLPSRPAFAYSLQKVPLFVGSLLVMIRHALQPLFGAHMIFTLAVFLVGWVVIAILWRLRAQKA